MELADYSLIGNAAAFMAVLGVLLASVLAFANKLLWVYEDPRIHEVESLLPASNCGACGLAGCHPFAEALIEGKITPSACTVSSREATEEIAAYLGVDAGEAEKRLAYLACAGGKHVARLRAYYVGMGSCRAAAQVAGGPKACGWGCLGLGDCVVACDFGAISLNRNGLPGVKADLCCACNDCVEVCPKHLFSLHPVSHRLWVACANLLHGDSAEADCEVACTACERCAKDAPEGLIEIRNNLAVVNYALNELASPDVIERCPTGAIVWLDPKSGVRKGKAAKPIFRTESLPARQAYQTVRM
ncbi:RnfABCDGE type electron transport complex subunit B [Magnetospira thiophila]